VAREMRADARDGRIASKGTLLLKYYLSGLVELDATFGGTNGDLIYMILLFSLVLNFLV
jgi:hypothetical protein